MCDRYRTLARSPFGAFPAGVVRAHGGILSSHDLLSDARPRPCEVHGRVTTLHSKATVVLVTATPPIVARFRDGPRATFSQCLLAIVGHHRTEEIGKVPGMSEIIICPGYSGGALDERQCSRIGVALLHATYEQALAHSPIGKRRE